MSDAVRPTLRRDAARNREQLVEAAATAFGERGFGVSVNAIASDAGVNVATLYRHFPTKDHLISAVLDVLLEPLERAVDLALAAQDDGALATFARAAVDLKGGRRGLVEALASDSAGEAVRLELRERSAAIVAPLVTLAHERGELRQDFNGLDLLLTMRMLSAVALAAEAAERDPEKFVELLLRGLRP